MNFLSSSQTQCNYICWNPDSAKDIRTIPLCRWHSNRL